MIFPCSIPVPLSPVPGVCPPLRHWRDRALLLHAAELQEGEGADAGQDGRDLKW